MANCCCCEVTVSGEAAQLKEFWDRLKAQDPEIIECNLWLKKYNGYYCSDLDAATVSKDVICFNMDTKWEPHLSEMADVSELFPKLTFRVQYEEPAMQIYGEATIVDGRIADNPMEPLEYHLNNNEAFLEQAQHLMDSETPWEGCKEILESDYFYVTPESYLEELAVKRIPFEELPLYAGHKWVTKAAHEMYQARLAGKTKKSAIEEVLQ